MKASETKIFVYAHWIGMSEASLMGILLVQQIKGRTAFSFEYDSQWLNGKNKFIIDPDLALFKGAQYPGDKENFGLILDSMPDTWGRTLMKRRALQIAQEREESVATLFETDFLLGVYDESRMGALRFKTDKEGPFLDNSDTMPTPPWSSLRELQYASEVLESDSSNEEVKKWLAILMAPGSSLGGARPKANIIDENDHLWIAKFPSKNDTVDKGAWEYLTYKLAINAGIQMSESKIIKVSGKHHTFLTKRFDRQMKDRIHFASAMTMCNYTEEKLRDKVASYLEIAEKIKYDTTDNLIDLEQLWRRIVFNIMVSNTDDHLRNHGFILKDGGWRLSPAYDINPSIDKDGLALNIDLDNNLLDLNLAKTVGVFFEVGEERMEKIINEVKDAVSKWKMVAAELSISRPEQELMAKAFRV